MHLPTSTSISLLLNIHHYLTPYTLHPTNQKHVRRPRAPPSVPRAPRARARIEAARPCWRPGSRMCGSGCFDGGCACGLAGCGSLEGVLGLCTRARRRLRYVSVIYIYIRYRAGTLTRTRALLFASGRRAGDEAGRGAPVRDGGGGDERAGVFGGVQGAGGLGGASD